MALVQHNNLPSIERMRSEGLDVCLPNQADDALPTIKIGFLNMMPDTALAATERQFLRLLTANSNVNCYFYPFSIAGVPRSDQAKSYIDEYYIDFVSLKRMNIDALIITGANVSQPLLQNEEFWPELEKVLCWARINVRSTVCSCLATHAAVKVFYDVDRKHMGDKCWGVFPHQVLLPQNALVENIDTNIMMCHSRFNNISQHDFARHNVDILIDSPQVGVQLACEKDMSIIYFQGHPEYDDISLLKEYKREIIRYLSQQRKDYPPVPKNYFNQSSLDEIEKYKQLVEKEGASEELLAEFPESELNQVLDNPWQKSAQTIFSNWLQLLVC
ncbi:MAG: homoserine O-succinyltransferase [Gammaproteobacteria bacterium]|nr:homoserine O-succinyltransferase [Gammaproteobacteria bacterium]